MGNYSIYVIDHARKSIYTAVYIQNRQLLENVNLVITQFIARQSPENLLIPSSLQYAENDIEELQKTAAAEYRLYFIHHSDVHELSLQNKIIINARVVTAQFKLLPPQKMLLNEFVALAINDKIPVRLQQRNNFPSENTTISIHYSDAECTHNYVCAVSDKDQFTLRTLAKLYLKQPNVFKTLSKRSAQEFEDIAYLELKALLGEQLLDFFNNIEVGNAYSFFKEFIKEQLLVHSRDCYFDFSPLEMLDYSTIDFAINHPLDHEHFEGEYRGIEEAHALDRNVTINAQARALLSMQENPEAAEVQRKVLRDFIIDNFYDGSIGARDCNFPLPRADQWPQQVFVIECIQFL